MPNRDGTGPEGKGPRTGRGMGPCPPIEKQLDEKRVNYQRGRGMGPCGGGMARGRCHGRRKGPNGITYYM